jgi:hypothetical protein
MAATLRRGLPSEPSLSDRDYCGCLALVYAAIGTQPVAQDIQRVTPGSRRSRPGGISSPHSSQ